MQNFSILSWNIQGEANITGYTFFKKIQPHLLNATADILVLQEVCNAKELLKDIAVLGNYNVFVPDSNTRRGSGFNHNVVLSKYPITQAHEMVLPLLGQTRYLESVTRADIRLKHTTLRIYNCHFPIFRAGVAMRLRELEYILGDAKGHEGPVILCGDLNTTIPKSGLNRTIISTWHMQPARDMIIDGEQLEVDEREIINQTLSRYGFTEAVDLATATWSPFKTKAWELFSLKLDWFMVKGLKIHGYKLGEYVSDHRAIEVQCGLDE